MEPMEECGSGQVVDREIVNHGSTINNNYHQSFNSGQASSSYYQPSGYDVNQWWPQYNNYYAHPQYYAPQHNFYQQNTNGPRYHPYNRNTNNAAIHVSPYYQNNNPAPGYQSGGEENTESAVLTPTIEENEIPPPGIEGLHEYRKRQSVYEGTPRNQDLYILLDKDDNFRGNLVLWYYNKHQGLDGKTRRILADILTELEMAKNIHLDYSLYKEHFEPIAKSIPIVFKNLVTSAWYKAGETLKDDERTKINPSGHLHRSYLVYREVLNDSGYFKKENKPKPKPSKGTDKIDVEVLYSSEVTDDNIEEVQRIWEKSYEARHLSLYLNKSGATIINKFKVLKTFVAPTLVLFDFGIRYENYLETLSKEWPKAASMIIQFLKMNNCESKKNPTMPLEPVESGSLCADYSKLEEVFDNNTIINTKDHEANLAFLLLPKLFDLNPRKHKKGSFEWKIKKEDVNPSFMIHISDHEKLSTVIQERSAYYDTLPLQNQPYIVICGNLKSATCCHAVLNDDSWVFKNSIDAVNFCFAFFATQKLEFSIACQHIWTFIQSEIYKLTIHSPIRAKEVIETWGKVCNSANTTED